ncbi:MAG: glycosyltransferase family 4 protein [Acidimicrobiaceae bacterium]|nr:glycosyltransferase family 4 protein [Ilumatobacter sp.]MCB9381418.1 glycosyltransferase family 4 protein [Acidimicrobiaceae bacterium]MCO5331328.1 glycosyltransferase family 4 protein [Ilumatobacteraceae bacterium]
MATILMTLALSDTSGASLVALRYASALRERGHEVALAYGPTGRPGAPLHAPIVPRFEELGAVAEYVPALARPIGSAAPAAVAALARRVGAAAIVGIQQRDRAVALRAARRVGVPGLVTLQNRHIFWGAPPVRLVKRRYYQWHLRHATAAVCVSDHVGREAVQRFGLPPAKVHVVRNAVAPFPTVAPEVAAAVRAEFAAEGRVLLASVGRIDRQKAQDVLLAALAMLPPSSLQRLRVVLVGGTTMGARSGTATAFLAELEAGAERLGLQDVVRFSGFRSDVAAVLAAADAYVQPSRWEGFPLALLEAMTAGLPVVATEGAGRPDGFVDGTHGWIVPSEDPGALAAALERMLALTAGERREMGAADAALVAAAYRVEDMTRGFVDVVERAISEA